jgi:sugar/nucleoside kinase (ribokinase family)
MESKRVLVFGGFALDIISRASSPIVQGTSNIGSITTTAGGVGHNIAETLHLFGVSTLLVSVIGQDSIGNFLLEHLKNIKMDISGIIINDQIKTSVYQATHDVNGELLVAVNDMVALETLSPIDIDRQISSNYPNINLIVFDTNLSTEAIRSICKLSSERKILTFCNPVSESKSVKLLFDDILPNITFICLNSVELDAMSPRPERRNSKEKEEKKDHEESFTQAKYFLSRGIKIVILTEGKNGVTIFNIHQHKHVDALPTENIVNVTGAGDSFSSGFVYVLSKMETIEDSFFDNLENFNEAIHFGLKCARLSLQSNHAVHPDIASVFSTNG